MYAYMNEGLTIVIVPTVALAIDQMYSSRNLFKNAGMELPEAYYSGLTPMEKQQILNKIEAGRLPILYISPEALLTTDFHDHVLKAAQSGLISSLIIDEAHLVADWGDSFRTEFQFLSIYRRKLLETSGHRLKTVLLSATYTDQTVEQLKHYSPKMVDGLKYAAMDFAGNRFLQST